MQELARYLCNDYDWRKVEATLSGLPQFITEIGGVGVLGSVGDLLLYEDATGIVPQSVPLPFDRWLCIEVRVEVDDPGRVQLFLDGTLIASRSDIDLLPGTGFSRIAVGLPSTDVGQPSARVYVDEVVIDTQPIGCD